MATATQRMLSLVLAIAMTAPAFALNGVGSSALITVAANQSDDSDGDGLKDDVELTAGTDPNNFDSDGDGMDDAYEIYSGLNPKNASDANVDLDGDGMTNVEEAAHGSMPYEADSDGDGWHDGVEVDRGTSPMAADDFPHTGVFGDVDADGVVSATDVQTVINGALGGVTAVPANVDGVNGVNSVDVQLVINALLAA